MDDNIRCKEIHYGDSPFRPDTHGILISGRRGRIFSVLYTAAGGGVHPTVLFFHGIPGCERNFDLAHALRRAGFHVMTFHYSGNWGSDGNYSLKNDLEDANTVLDFILRDDTYGFDKTRIYAVGHSMGGFVCGQVTAKRPEIRAGGCEVLPFCGAGSITGWGCGWKLRRARWRKSRFCALPGLWTLTRRPPCTVSRWPGRSGRKGEPCSRVSNIPPTISLPTTG